MTGLGLVGVAVWAAFVWVGLVGAAGEAVAAGPGLAGDSGRRRLGGLGQGSGLGRKGRVWSGLLSARRLAGPVCLAAAGVAFCQAGFDKG